MRATEYLRYGTPGEVLRRVDMAVPAPGKGEVLVRVHAASVNALDWRLMVGRPWLARMMAGGLRRPTRTRPGVDLAGTVAAIGSGVSRFAPGDAVFGTARGAFAEYVLAKEEGLVALPGNASFADAAAVPVAALTALQGLRDHGRVQPGQQVLVDGASGGVGSFAVQVARALGAVVTAVCSPANVATARRLGADRVLDYTREDFLREERRYDVVFAANAHRPLSHYRRALKPGGIHVMAGGGMPQIVGVMLLGPLLSRLSRRRSVLFMAKFNHADLDTLAGLLASGALTPVIDRRYPLDATAEAIAYVARGHAKGKVVIEMAPTH